MGKEWQSIFKKKFNSWVHFLHPIFCIIFVSLRKECTVIVKIVDRKNVPVCQKTPKSSRIFTVQHFLGGFFCVKGSTIKNIV